MRLFRNGRLVATDPLFLNHLIEDKKPQTPALFDFNASASPVLVRRSLR